VKRLDSHLLFPRNATSIARGGRASTRRRRMVADHRQRRMPPFEVHASGWLRPVAKPCLRRRGRSMGRGRWSARTTRWAARPQIHAMWHCASTEFGALSVARWCAGGFLWVALSF